MGVQFSSEPLRGPGPVRVVFDGQSLNLTPSSPPGANMPGQLMRRFEDVVGWENISIGGHGWKELADLGWGRLAEQTRPSGVDVLVMNGGQGDIIESDDFPTNGPGAYVRMRDYANAARLLGFDVIIACTLPSFGPDMLGTGLPTPAGRQAWVDLNNLIRGNADGAFDYVVEAATGQLADATQPWFFVDRLHLNEWGVRILADRFEPVLASVIAGATP